MVDGAPVTVGVSLVGGFAGNVEKGPSCTERLFGGLPRTLPEPPLEVDDHALEIAGVCLLFARLGDLLDEVGFAELGSSNAGLAEKLWRGITADCG